MKPGVKGGYQSLKKKLAEVELELRIVTKDRDALDRALTGLRNNQSNANPKNYSTYDPINPQHYKDYFLNGQSYEVADCLEAWGMEKKALLYTAIKYIVRAGRKDPTKEYEDVRKAKWYLDRYVENLGKQPKGYA